MLVHGFTDVGKDDPRLRHFARQLSEARFLVLVPQIESLTRFSVSADNIDAVRHAVRYLRARSADGVSRVGVAAISYSAGPAIIAALNARPRDAVDFVFSVGGYYDLVQGISFATTGYYRDGAEWRYRAPHRSGRWLLLLGHADQAPARPDRALLLEIADRKLDDPQADVTALVDRLSPEGRAAFELAANRDPARVPELIARLPEQMRRQIATLDVSRYDLSRFTARLILLHGAGDPMIPPSHSEALAAAVPPGQAELYVVDGLMHVDVQPGWRDALHLWQAGVALLRARDGIE